MPCVGAACSGSALEGTGPDGTGEVEEVAEVVETIDDTDVVPDTSDTSGDTTPDETDVEPGDTTADTEVEVVEPAAWEPVSLGDEGVVDDVVLVRDTLGFAASGTRVLRWDGRLWSAYGTPGENALHGVWADDDLVVVVGDGGAASTRPVDGGAWEALAGGPAVALRAVVARGPDDVFAAGDDGTVAHWDGAAWATRFTSGTIDLQAMWLRPGSSGDDGVYAVGSGGQLVTRVDGTWKAAQITFGTVVLEDIIGAADGTLVAVGDKHTITVQRPQTGTWQGQVTNDERQRDLTALARSGDTLRIFGVSGAVLAGAVSAWNVDTSAATVAGVRDFAVADAAVAAGGGSLVMALAGGGDGIRYDGEAWTSVATVPDATLTAFAETAGGELWAVGTDGFIARRGAQGWTVVPSSVTHDLFGLAVLDAGTLVAVGAKGTLVRIAFEGEAGAVTVTTIAAPVPVDLFGVATVADGSALAVGRGGTLLTIGAGASASVRASGTTADLKAVGRGGDGRMWLAGAFGTLLRLPEGDGAGEALASGVGGSLSAMVATDDGVFVVGDNGVVLRARADGVTLEHELPGAFLYGVATSDDGAAVAAGAGGLVLVRAADGTWTREVVSERGATFDAVHVARDGSEALVGGVFRVMHVETRKLALGSSP